MACLTIWGTLIMVNSPSSIWRKLLQGFRGGGFWHGFVVFMKPAGSVHKPRALDAGKQHLAVPFAHDQFGF
jgi:hypothetical protein